MSKETHLEDGDPKQTAPAQTDIESTWNMLTPLQSLYRCIEHLKIDSSRCVDIRWKNLTERLIDFAHDYFATVRLVTPDVTVEGKQRNQRKTRTITTTLRRTLHMSSGGRWILSRRRKAVADKCPLHVRSQDPGTPQATGSLHNLIWKFGPCATH
jgi:hypothetical protein